MKLNAKKLLKLDSILKLAICLLLISPVHLFPQPKAQHSLNSDQVHKDGELKTQNLPTSSETLNSKIAINVNARNEIEKPVDSIDAVRDKPTHHVESEKSAPYGEKESESSRQFSFPFMAVPANWLATFQPSNAFIITEKAPVRIWAIGSVSRFPPFIERFVQRIQSYYSTYKYQDLSRPATLAIINPQYHQQENTGAIETIPFDPVEDESTEITTDIPTSTDYFETTTDFSYDGVDTIACTDSNESDEISI